MLGEVPLSERFARARAAGFDGIDLRGDEVSGVLSVARALADQFQVEIPTVYGRLRVPLVAATAAERTRAMDIVRERLRCASALGASALIVVPVFGEPRFSFDWPGGIDAVELALLAVELKELATDAAACEVAILLEPLNRQETHLLRSPAATADFVRRIDNPWVAAMADTYHMDLEHQDAVAELRHAGDQLRLMHLSDRHRRLPGAGGIDFPTIIRALRTQDYRGYLGFECRGTFEVDDLKESVSYVRSLM